MFLHSFTPPPGTLPHTNFSERTKTFTPEDNFNRGIAHLQKKSANEAIHHFNLAAEAGYIPAQLQLAKLNLEGQGFKANFHTALKWLTEVTDQEGRNTLFEKEILQAKCLIKDIEHDKEYIKKYESNFELTDHSTTSDSVRTNALYNLGIMHHYGMGNLKTQAGKTAMGEILQPDFAGHFFKEASELKHASAMYELALIYQTGNKFFPKNTQQAKTLLTNAAQLGHSDAQCQLGDMHRLGIDTPLDIAAAARCYLDAAKQKNTKSIPGLLLVADAFEKIKQNGRALKYIRSAADLGNAYAQFKVGIHYIKATGSPCYRPLGIGYLEEASKQGHPMALYHLGLETLGGQGLSLIRQAAEKGLDLANLYMGNYHRQKHASLMGNDDDFKKAINCYKNAATTEPTAYVALAEMARDGGGFFSAHKPNIDEAERYFKLAVTNGGMTKEAANKAFFAMDEKSFHLPIFEIPQPTNFDNNL